MCDETHFPPGFVLFLAYFPIFLNTFNPLEAPVNFNSLKAAGTYFASIPCLKDTNETAICWMLSLAPLPARDGHPLPGMALSLQLGKQICPSRSRGWNGVNGVLSRGRRGRTPWILHEGVT